MQQQFWKSAERAHELGQGLGLLDFPGYVHPTAKISVARTQMLRNKYQLLAEEDF